VRANRRPRRCTARSPIPATTRSELALAPLADRFTMQQLEEVLRRFELPGVHPDMAALAKSTIHWLASSNYELAFPARSHLSQRVLFPRGPSESHGMEDARFVRFTRTTAPRSTSDLHGVRRLPHPPAADRDPGLLHLPHRHPVRSAARNKGIAFFPRRIGGRYVALARSDAENNFLMWSDHLRVWDESPSHPGPGQALGADPDRQLGAPIETEAGWLVITHGVGPMRTYALGRDAARPRGPGSVLGHLPDPLLVPQEDERDGYVPNVVYSCGQIVHDGTFVIAYGASDTDTVRERAARHLDASPACRPSRRRVGRLSGSRRTPSQPPVEGEVLVDHPVDVETGGDRRAHPLRSSPPRRPDRSDRGVVGVARGTRSRPADQLRHRPSRVAITGVPQAMASTTLKPNGSSKSIRCSSAIASPSTSCRSAGPTLPR
jgi:predicted GH43/DUF377 family glycosyl hydrolase